MEPRSEFGMSLEKVASRFVIDHDRSGNMLVLRTPPGHAGVVAAALDREGVSGVLGCIAGDDTVFVCIAEKTKHKEVLESIGLKQSA